MKFKINLNQLKLKEQGAKITIKFKIIFRFRSKYHEITEIKFNISLMKKKKLLSKLIHSKL